MNDLDRERAKGLSLWYLKDVRLKRWLLGRGMRTPGFGLAAQLFACMTRAAVERLGAERAEALLKEAIEGFGFERGRRIAERVKKLGKPLSFKNWLIYTDIDPVNFGARPRLENGDLVAEVEYCAFHRAAQEWGLGDFSKIYCKYADFAILRGYNPLIRLELATRHETGRDHCVFRYRIKE